MRLGEELKIATNIPDAAVPTGVVELQTDLHRLFVALEAQTPVDAPEVRQTWKSIA